jgi:hypothetical protein
VSPLARSFCGYATRAPCPITRILDSQKNKNPKMRVFCDAIHKVVFTYTSEMASQKVVWLGQQSRFSY